MTYNKPMKNKTNYTIQFFHGLEGVWKGTGSGTFYDLAQAKQVMRKQAEMCDYMVDFRIEEVA